MKLDGVTGRVLIGTVLGLAVFLLVMYAPGWSLAGLVAAWSVLATLEFLRLLRPAGIELNPWLLGLLNASIVAAAWLGWLPGYLLAPIAVVMVLSVLLADPRPRTAVYGIFTLVYVGFLPAHLVLVREVGAARGLSPWLVMFPLLLTWLNDTAAWGIGRLVGRTRLMPRLSPKKTWEGFIAGLVASAVFAAVVLSRLEPFSDRPWQFLAVAGIGLGTISQVGDLFESIFKRAVAVKDSSTALGEHGGFLDRVDSLLFTIPAWYWLLRIYLP
jgi:phosphatidate cytidylyltransferase